MSRLGRPFHRLLAATVTSDLADGLGRTALPLAAASYTRSPVAVSGLVTFAFLPWLLFALPSGALVDRWDRRRAMAVANVARAVASAGLVAVVLSGHGGVAALYVLAFVLGVAETVYDSAVRALLPQVVPAADLDRANGLLTVGEMLGQTFVGAPLGSLAFAAAAVLPFAFGAVGFAAAAALILLLRGGFRPVRDEAHPVGTIRSDVADGVRWLRGHALLRGLTLVSAVTAMAESMATGVLVLYVLEVLRLPTGAYGVLLLAGGAAAAVSGVLTPVVARRTGRVALVSTASAVNAVLLGLLATTRDGVVAGALFAAASAMVMVWNVLTMSLRQTLVPPALFGRVQGAYRTLVWGAIPVGSLLGGVLASWLGIRAVFVVVGAVQLVAAAGLARLLVRHRATVDPERVAQPASRWERTAETVSSGRSHQNR